MAKEVIMPKFGMTQETAEIIRWLINEGETVEKGDPICEVETDKTIMEVESPTDGILTDIYYKEGDIVPVTMTIAVIVTENEYKTKKSGLPKPALVKNSITPTLKDSSEPLPNANSINASPLAKRLADTERVDVRFLTGSGPTGKVMKKDVEQFLQAKKSRENESLHLYNIRATPSARRLSKEYHIDLNTIKGSGPGGRIQGIDVKSSIDQTILKEPIATVFPSTSMNLDSQSAEVIPLIGMRRTIAQRMQASYQQAPHIMLSMDIDMTMAISMRKRYNDLKDPGQLTISMTAVVVKASALALQELPILNSYFQEDKIFMIPDINVGVAVALEDGLIVPVIHNANEKNIDQIGREVAELSQAAHEKRLKPSNVSNGTFTISNLGMFGIDHFTSIINPPQIGILAVGCISRRFIPNNNDFPVVRSMMTVTLSIDHRAIDGAIGAKFLNNLKNGLESGIFKSGGIYS